MSDAKSKIQKELMGAMKAKDEVRSSVLKMVKSEILLEESKGKDSAVDEDGLQKIIQSMVKKRRQSITEFEKGNRADLADKEKAEIAILEEYLPEAVSADTIEKAIQDVAGDRDLTMKDMGPLMGQVMAKFKGQNIDGKLVSELVKKFLQ